MKRTRLFIWTLFSLLLFSCEKDKDVIDKSIIGLWAVDEGSKECEVIASDAYSSEIIKNQLLDNYTFIYSDTILFAESGEFVEVDGHRGFTYRTHKSQLEIIPPEYMSYPMYTFAYKVSGNNALVLSAVQDNLNYFYSNHYLNLIGLDTTKVSVQKIQLSTTYKRISY
ncbi:MAG: hypothetical protein EZS26_003677 [Candidatus Ordinivivax streblomastigis]|uniref:Uncharacterized protein n=1 Tax=Candidatus Ordinivivax streblomastigis TaxID=2540710 RepID=A0A5M8NY29_9BACT|nr:MAG: hypothetical protein EZS26_003677 [Candidatus Ordinivivax streblomastigis]